MWTSHVVREILPNGLTVLVQPDDAATAVAVVTHVRAGYFDEPDEWTGISHVLEHMYFKGTVRRGPGDMARETQQLGGYLNAGTIYDKTVYYTVLPASDGGLERALDIQADALTSSRIDPQELARELEVIVQEAKRKLDNPSAVTVEGLYELMFDHHRMRRWRIGTEAGLRKLTARDVLSYYRTRYTPDRVIVGIAGNVDPGAALQLASETYGDWNREPEQIERSPAEVELPGPRFRSIVGDVEQPLAVIGWHTPGAMHDDTPALNMAAAILSLGRGSELYRRLRIPGIAQSANAVNYTPTELGVFELFIQAAADTFDHAVQCALETVAGTLSRPTTTENLERVRNLLRTGWSRGFETTDGRATALCAYEALGGYALLDEHFDRMLALTPADIAETAARYLAAGRCSAVVYLPHGASTGFNSESWPPGVRAPAPRPGSVAVVREITADVGGAPVSTFERHTFEDGVTLMAAGGGGDVLVKHKPGTELLWIGILSDARRRESAGTAGLSALLARAALRGAGQMDGEILASRAELLGGSVTPLVFTEACGCGITVPKHNLKPALALLHAVFTAPQLNRDEVIREARLQANDAARIRDDMFQYPVERVLQTAFGDTHLYGLPSLGFEDPVSRYTEVEVRSWLDVHLGSQSMIVVVGDVDGDGVLEAVSSVMDGFAASRRETGAMVPAGWNSSQEIEERDKAQSALAFAFPAPVYGSPDRPVLEVMSAVLSGMAGRLFLELRDRMSLAYTVMSLPWQRSIDGAFLTYIATSPDREEEAVSAMMSELCKLSGETVSSEELDRARSYTAGLKEIGRQTVSGVAGQLVKSYLYGGVEQYAGDIAAFRQVTAADIQRVAQDVFRDDVVCRFTVRGTGAAR